MVIEQYLIYIIIMSRSYYDRSAWFESEQFMYMHAAGSGFRQSRSFNTASAWCLELPVYIHVHDENRLSIIRYANRCGLKS